jgi:hypothetical protein
VTSTVSPRRYSEIALEVDVHGLVAEDVLDLHGPDLRREVGVAGDQLVQPRQRLHRHSCVTRTLDDLLAHVAGGGRNRDQELVGPVVAEDVRQLLGRPEHADAVEPEVLLARIVVDHADRRVPERTRLLHLADDELARVARADDDHFLAARGEARCTGSLEDRARKQARARDETQQEQPVEDRDPAWQPSGVRRREEVDDEARGETATVTPAGGAPYARVET